MSNVVIGDILPYTQATAIAGQTVFGTTWTADDATDVIVYQTPVGSNPDDATQILSPSDYTVAFIGDDEEVQITLITPASAGDIITIIRQTPAARMNLYSNTNFTPDMLNQDFGILTLVDQQAQLVNQKVSPRYNYSATITDVVDTILPILGPNQTWAKNAAGTAIVALDIVGGVSPGTQNQLAWYTSNGAIVSGLPTANNGILATSAGGVPSISPTIPLPVQANITKLGTQTQTLNMGSHLISNVSDPVSSSDACTKNYADQIAAGLNPIPGAYAASTANLTGYTYNNGSSGVGATLTAPSNGVFTVDGVSPPVGSRFLYKNDTTGLGAYNGIYTVTTSTAGSPAVLTRATDYDTAGEIEPGDLVAVENGTANSGSSWIQTATITTIGTDAITFSSFFSPATYLKVANNLSDLVSTSTSINNLFGGSGGLVPINKLAAIAAYTVLANNTGSSAQATATATTSYQPVLTKKTGGQSGNYTPGAGATWFKVKGWGPGGGGGGAANTAASGAATGAGGDGGGYFEKTYKAPFSAPYPYSVGTGGTGATAGNNAGNAGTNTTFDTLTASSGGGGGGSAALSTNDQLAATPAFNPGTGTGGDVNVTGGYAEYSMVFFGGGPQATSNYGGNGAMGSPGGHEKIGQGTGTTGQTPGGGGGGGVSINAGGTAAGGPGGDGLLIIEEYYI